MTSLSPLHTVGDQIVEALRLHRRDCPRAEAREAVREMLALVRFPDPTAALDAYPFQLSGGLRQRAMIAMALVCRPALLVADEPTTALDVIVQARTLKLMRDLQSELHMALLLITHDLGVVASLADEVAVIYHGRLMERGGLEDLFRDPRHPYLEALMRAVPRMGMDRSERLTPVRSIDVRGEGSPLANRGEGPGAPPGARRRGRPPASPARTRQQAVCASRPVPARRPPRALGRGGVGRGGGGQRGRGPRPRRPPSRAGRAAAAGGGPGELRGRPGGVPGPRRGERMRQDHGRQDDHARGGPR